MKTCRSPLVTIVRTTLTGGLLWVAACLPTGPELSSAVAAGLRGFVNAVVNATLGDAINAFFGVD